MLVANFTSRIPNMGERVAHIKSCELLEVLHATNFQITDNQQPSFSRNTNEGSTTNSQDLPSNVEVGNADTSAGTFNK